LSSYGQGSQPAAPESRQAISGRPIGCGPAGLCTQARASAITGSIGKLRRCEKGAVAVEFGLIAIPLIMGSLGIIEFGRALWMRNAMEHQADLVERSILILERPSVGGTPYIRSSEGREILKSRLKANFTSASVGAPQVVSRNGVNYEFSTITVSYNVELIIPFLAQDRITMTVERKVPVMN
jgi:Flp pilus assembly protein TadG